MTKGRVAGPEGNPGRSRFSQSDLLATSTNTGGECQFEVEIYAEGKTVYLDLTSYLALAPPLTLHSGKPATVYVTLYQNVVVSVDLPLPLRQWRWFCRRKTPPAMQRPLYFPLSVLQDC